LNGYLLLGLACTAFVGTHFLMSHPLRKSLVRGLGSNGFALVYSVVSLGLFYWMIVEFGRAPKEAVLWRIGDVLWVIASLLTLLAAVLFVGSFVRNPSFPGVPDALAAQEPSGVFRVTRHPMMWGFALWGIAHILVAPRIDNFIFAGSIVFLALAGAKAQEIKKAALVGVEWDAWLRKTSYGLRPSALLRVGVTPWLAGILLWLVATWAHPWLGVAGAGIYRWLVV
jgi:uncharacterized membrane protein